MSNIQPGSRIALSNNDVLTSAQQDALEACYLCGNAILGEVHLSDDDMLEHFSEQKCVEKYDENQNEAAYEAVCRAR